MYTAKSKSDIEKYALEYIFFILLILNIYGDDVKLYFIGIINFKHAPNEKVPNLSPFIEDKLRFCTLHFSVREDLWPYCNAYVKARNSG